MTMTRSTNRAIGGGPNRIQQAFMKKRALALGWLLGILAAAPVAGDSSKVAITPDSEKRLKMLPKDSQRVLRKDLMCDHFGHDDTSLLSPADQKRYAQLKCDSSH